MVDRPQRIFSITMVGLLSFGVAGVWTILSKDRERVNDVISHACSAAKEGRTVPELTAGKTAAISVDTLDELQEKCRQVGVVDLSKHALAIAIRDSFTTHSEASPFTSPLLAMAAINEINKVEGLLSCTAE